MILKENNLVIIYPHQEKVLWFFDLEGNFLKDLLISTRIENPIYSKNKKFLFIGEMAKQIIVVDLTKIEVGCILKHHTYIMTKSLI